MGSEEKVKKAMVDAARLADELRAEQDHVAVQTKNKRSLETTMADMENRLADANESAMKGGKAAMAKLESRIRELEIELGNVQARTSDNLKGHQKAERKIKELQFQNDEDKKNQVAMSDLAQAAGQDQDLQEADRVGRGDRRPQPGQVQEGPAGAGGDRGP